MIWRRLNCINASELQFEALLALILVLIHPATVIPSAKRDAAKI